VLIPCHFMPSFGVLSSYQRHRDGCPMSSRRGIHKCRGARWRRPETSIATSMRTYCPNAHAFRKEGPSASASISPVRRSMMASDGTAIEPLHGSSIKIYWGNTAQDDNDFLFFLKPLRRLGR
jgi:hypothetical protein